MTLIKWPRKVDLQKRDERGRFVSEEHPQDYDDEAEAEWWQIMFGNGTPGDPD